MAGTFFAAGGWAFLDYGTGENCVIVTTRDETYKQIVVQLEPDQDAAAIAAQIKGKAAQ